MLEIRDLKVSYGAINAIHGISLQVKQGDIVTLIGANGAGKTTLLNAFTWVLYEKYSAAFSASEHLVNKRALYEGEPSKAVGC